LPLACSWPQQTAKPRPDREINRHVKLKNKPAKNGDRCEPGEYDPEECQAGDVTEKQVSKPRMTRLRAGKPNCGDEWGQRNPAKPRQVERRKASRVKKPATDRSQPRPKLQYFPPISHAARMNRRCCARNRIALSRSGGL
jgi:hypothetical protein